MSNTALIVLDFVSGITQSDRFKPYIEQRQIFKKANQLIAHARKTKQLIIFVKIGFSDSYVELANRSPLFVHNKPNNWLKLSENSTDFDPALDYRPEDAVIIKHRVNAFYATPLEAILNANQIDHLILCGVSTNLAVEGTARDAHDRNYSVTIAEDACAATNDENQEKSISIMKMIAEVKVVDEICRS